jgi:probable blue pigment (indigoidine) exporter
MNVATRTVGGSGAALTGRPPPLRMLWVTAALGACFVGVRWGLRDAPVLWFAALRALLGGAVLAVVAVVQHRPLPRSGGIWAGIGVLGFVNVTVAFAAMFAGIAGVATGTAAVLANAQPLLILLPAWWLYGEKLSARAAVALAVGFGGLVVVALPGGGGRGALLSLLSAVAVTSGTLMVRHLRNVDVVVASAAHFLIGGVVLAVFAAVSEGFPHIHWTPRFAAVLTFLALIGTAAAFLVWFVEAQRCALASLTAWIFLVPVFGLLIGFVVLGERPDVWTVSGIALVLLAMRVALTQPGAAGTGPGHLHALNRSVGSAAAPAVPDSDGDRSPRGRPRFDGRGR